MNSGSDLPFKTNFATDYFLTTEDKHFKAVTSEKSSGFFTKILNKAIMTVTGYEVTSIDVADRLQEDLGIDSIKKAEIIFKVLDEVGIKNNTTSQNIRVSDLSTINDLLHYFDYQKRTYLQSDMNVESLQNREFVNANEIYIKKENGHLIKSCMRLFEVFEFHIDCNKQSENLKQDLFRFIFNTSEKNKIVHILINEENFLNKIPNEADINLPLNYLEKIVNYFSSFRLSNAVYGKDIHFQFILDTDNCPEMIILRFPGAGRAFALCLECRLRQFRRISLAENAWRKGGLSATIKKRKQERAGRSGNESPQRADDGIYVRRWSGAPGDCPAGRGTCRGSGGV